MIYNFKIPVRDVDAIDLCEPVAPFNDLQRKTQALLSGYVEHCKTNAQFSLAEKFSKGEVQTKTDGDSEVVEITQESAEMVCAICSSHDKDFRANVVERFSNVRKNDKGILKYNDKPVDDLVFNSISQKELSVLAVLYTMLFL